MIISHKHKFIFIKTNKTAGTSIEIGLSRFCGDNDIITPITAPDEKIRNELGYKGPQNYAIPRKKYKLKDWINLLRFGSAEFYNHMPASEMVKYVSTETWSDYYKFCFERHPYDRIVSLYFFRNKVEPRPTIDEFLPEAIKSLKERGIGLYTIDGEVVVDRIYRFEELTASLGDVSNRLGIDTSIEIPRAKGGFRPVYADYEAVLTDSARGRIREAFRQEALLLDYEL